VLNAHEKTGERKQHPMRKAPSWNSIVDAVLWEGEKQPVSMPPILQPPILFEFCTVLYNSEDTCRGCANKTSEPAYVGSLSKQIKANCPYWRAGKQILPQSVRCTL